ncbi:MAG TPA: putative quinol monooxygenase [Mycobacteriales bacterium]|nr:putative quinol monooxygenase [Mycobacteriales bacterium]
MTDQIPIVLVAVFEAKPETWGELRGRLEDLVEVSRAEPGCVRYELHTDVGEPRRFVFLEEWADADALALHNKAPHLLALLEDLPRLTERSPAAYQLRRISD